MRTVADTARPRQGAKILKASLNRFSLKPTGRISMRIIIILLFLIISGCGYFSLYDEKGKFPELTQPSLENLYKSLNKDRQKLAHELMREGFICYVDTKKDGFGKYGLKCYRGQCAGGYLEDTQIKIVEIDPLVEEISAGGVLYHGGCRDSDVKDYNPSYLGFFIGSYMKRLN